EFCLDETLQITNTSVNADTFQWNFCIGALTGTGNASQLVDLPIQSSFGTSVIEQNDSLIVIALDNTTGDVHRIAYDLEFQNIGANDIIGTLTPGVRNLDIRQINSEWIGFVGGGTNLEKLDFGSSITSSGFTSETITLTTPFTNIVDVELLYENDEDYLLVLGANGADRVLSVLAFNNGIDQQPSSQNQYNITSTDNLFGISMIREAQSWKGIVVGAQNAIHSIDFVDGL
ncbi:MAG: hypothetical protein RIG77_22980, partial [Cyclobacteriaceae bacterium]